MTTLRCTARAGLPALLLLALLAPPADAQEARRGAAKPAPDLANEKYGPHPRNVLDLWKAKSDKPTPLVVFIHGGGFRGGSKEALSPALLEGLLAKGLRLKEKMDKLGIECTVRHRDEGARPDREIVEFFARHLKAAGAKSGD